MGGEVSGLGRVCRGNPSLFIHRNGFDAPKFAALEGKHRCGWNVGACLQAIRNAH